MNFYVISIFRNPYARGTSTTINQIYEELLQTGAVNEEFQATVLLFKQDYAHTFQDPNCTGSNGTGKGKGPKTAIPKRTAANEYHFSGSDLNFIILEFKDLSLKNFELNTSLLGLNNNLHSVRTYIVTSGKFYLSKHSRSPVATLRF